MKINKGNIGNILLTAAIIFTIFMLAKPETKYIKIIKEYSLLRDTCSSKLDTVNVIFDTVISHLKYHEGLRLNKYSDGGVPAIGYGHRMTSKILDSITEDQADSILENDYLKKYNYVKKTYNLTGNRLHAISCFIFNCGEGTLAKNKNFTNAIKNNKDISKYILRYNNYKGKPHKRLTERRNFELNLWKSWKH